MPAEGAGKHIPYRALYPTLAVFAGGNAKRM